MLGLENKPQLNQRIEVKPTMNFVKRLTYDFILPQLLIVVAITFLVWSLLGCWNVSPFSEQPNDLYYSLFSSFIQGTLALVAFFGAIAMFQLQNHEREMGYLCEKFYSQNPLQVLENHKKVGDGNPNITSDEYLEKMYFKFKEIVSSDAKTDSILKRMSEIHRFEWEIRDATTGLSIMAFLGVAIVMFLLIIINGLSEEWSSLAVALTFSLTLIILFDAARLIRRVIGYSYQKNY